MTGTPVTANWAYIGKEPQAGIGYTVLATSMGDINFGPFIGRYVPGSPNSSVPPDAPDAPPWVTLGPVAGPDEILITVSVRDPWKERDHAGRPVWPQRLFLIRYSDLARADASYQTIWNAASATAISAEDSEDNSAVSLQIDRQPLGELIETINFYGFEALAAVAAAVLEGSVVVAGAGNLDRGQRLALLDAVTALLPYGFRADLSVSSVVDNTSKHGIRLSLADFVNDGQRLQPLREPGPGPVTETGQYYLEMLRKKAERPGLGPLLEHMWNAKGPYSFADPGKGISILPELDFYGALRREASNGPVPLVQLRKFLADPVAAERSWESFDPRSRDNILASYLPGRKTEAAALVIPYWRFMGNDATRLINLQLDGGDIGAALWCLQTANEMEDPLLAELLVPNEKVHSQRASVLIEVLRQRAIPGPNKFPYTCDSLRYDAAGKWQACLFRDLLIRELGGDRKAGDEKAWRWISWLCLSHFTAKWDRPDWVRALDFVALAPPSERSIASVRSLIVGDLSWALVLMRLANHAACTGELLDQTDQQFIQLAAQVPGLSTRHDGAREQLLIELNHPLWELGLRPGAIASIDVARVLLGGEPGDFPDQQQQAVLDGYFDGLGAAFKLPVVRPRFAHLEHEFLRYAVPGEAPDELTAGGVRLLNTWATDSELVSPLLEYIAGLDPAAYPYHPGLTSAFWNALNRHPALARYAAGNQVFTAVKEALQAPLLAFRRDVTEDAVTSTVLGRACYNARRAGLSVEGIIRALASAGAERLGPGRLEEVLREFQGLLYYGYPEVPDAGRDPRRTSESDLFACYRLIIRGEFGPDFAEDFRRYLAGKLRDDISTRQGLLMEILPPGRKNEAFSVPAAERRTAKRRKNAAAAITAAEQPASRPLRNAATTAIAPQQQPTAPPPRSAAAATTAVEQPKARRGRNAAPTAAAEQPTARRGRNAAPTAAAEQPTTPLPPGEASATPKKMMDRLPWAHRSGDHASRP